MISPGRPTSPEEIGRLNRLGWLLETFVPPYLKVLDFGCGNGIVTEGRGLDVVGYEPGRRVLGGEQYGQVVCFDVLEHVALPKLSMMMIRLSLCPNGRLLITVPNQWWFFETHAKWPWNRLPFFNWGPWRGWLRDRVGRGVRCYTKAQIRELVEVSGFRVLEIGYLSAPLDQVPWLRKLVWNHHVTDLPFFATNIYLTAVRK